MINQTDFTGQQIELWHKIRAFKLDMPRASFTFSDRLARENNWSKTYTLRVMEEYKRFLFLSSISDKPITPSDPVDQAWHLHLTYTQSYWKDLCQKILHQEFHHHPTKGGVTEQRKFAGYYKTTFRLYQDFFQEEPPGDIWHDSKTRFSEINFVRVNKDRYWLLAKPPKKLVHILVAILALAIFMAVLYFSVESAFVLAVTASVIFGISKIVTIKPLPPKGDYVKHNKSGNASCGGDSGCSAHSGCSGDGGCSGCGGCGS